MSSLEAQNLCSYLKESIKKKVSEKACLEYKRSGSFIKSFPPPLPFLSGGVGLCSLPGAHGRGAALRLGRQHLRPVGHREQEQPAEPGADHDGEREVSGSTAPNRLRLNTSLFSALLPFKDCGDRCLPLHTHISC